MKAIFCLLFLVLPAQLYAELPTAPADCNPGKLNPRAPAETRQFEFLVGHYQIHLHAWQGDAWSPPQPGVTARWNGWYGLGGMAIYDEWYNPDPAQNAEGNHGVNVRLYDDEENVWKMMWIATANKTVQNLRAEMQGGVLTMWQLSPERPDFKANFKVHDSDHWERISFTKDEEANWVKQYKLAASRLPCE